MGHTPDFRERLRHRAADHVPDGDQDRQWLRFLFWKNMLHLSLHSKHRPNLSNRGLPGPFLDMIVEEEDHKRNLRKSLAEALNLKHKSGRCLRAGILAKQKAMREVCCFIATAITHSDKCASSDHHPFNMFSSETLGDPIVVLATLHTFTLRVRRCPKPCRPRGPRPVTLELCRFVLSHSSSVHDCSLK